MKAVRTRDMTGTHIAKGCFDLPTKIVHDPEYGLIVESVWELDGEELMEILQSKRVRLRIVGGQPPVSLQVEPIDEGAK